jgi:predicted GNAT superfamily acetyltransferase
VFFHEHLAERDRGAGDVLGKGFAGAGGAGRDLYRHVQAEAAVGTVQHVLCQVLVDEGAVEEEGDHGSTKVLGQSWQVQGW